MKPFSVIDEKLLEAEFFLERIEQAGPNFLHARFYFSAFVSAARSVTFALQSVMGSHQDFATWYEPEAAKLRATNLARFFVERRNETIKEGETRIDSGMFTKDENGKGVIKLYFSTRNPEDPLEVIEEDVVSMSRNYLTLLQELIQRCRGQFPQCADPDWIFSEENLLKSNLAIEDLEENLGFPRGWTAVDGISISERLRLLRDATPPMLSEAVLRKKLKDS